MMTSDKQIAANRENATHSTGPRTPEGKARSSQNAFKHGLLAQTVILKGESLERFNTFVEGFHAEFQPRTSSEINLVNNLATARWRGMRATNFEAVQLDKEFDSQVDPSFEDLDNATRTGIAFGQLADHSRVLDLLNRTEARLQRQFDGAYDRMIRAQTKRQNNGNSIAPPPANEQTNPNEKQY